jgi:DNA-binding transcriptional ArsR family regulator
MQEMELFERRATVVKALASAARLAIVDELSRTPRTVGDLADLVELDISTVSRHLSVLRNAAIVSSIREGNSIVYSLRAVCILGFFACIEKVLSGEDTTAAEGCCGSRKDA